MKTLLATAAFFFSALSLSGCFPVAPPPSDSRHPSAVTLDWPGRWEATELMGKPLEPGPSSPWIRFDPDGGRAHGFGGCNRFSGSVELAPGNRIRFSKLAATMMACPESNVEQAFMRVLGTADSYHLGDSELVLHRARMAPLARFRAVPGTQP